MISSVILRRSIAAARPALRTQQVRTIFIAPGDHKRHAEPGFMWLGNIVAASVTTFLLCQAVVCFVVRRGRSKALTDDRKSLRNSLHVRYDGVGQQRELWVRVLVDDDY